MIFSFRLLFLYLITLLATFANANSNATASATTAANEQVCASCHSSQVKEWRSSHHFHAMEKATKTSVLADFDSYSLDYHGSKVKFYTKDDSFFIVMPNQAGAMTEYQVTHTFGYEPLQQYMFDFGKGRLQFFPFAWDSRTKNEGGQRWFILHPDQSDTDIFHWTQMGQNWNHMCADCHSTDFEKNFDVKNNQFNSRFSAINVSCNACHGDSKEHLKWANGNTKIKQKGFATYIGPKTPLFTQQADGAMKSVSALKDSEQINVCATCHARRTNLSDRKDPHDFFNAFQPSLLLPNLYHVDGQVWDENYVWGSFKQSKMHEAGVTCTNCHNPHSGKLTLTGNQTCTQCHAAATFDSSKHHGHKVASTGSQCVDCHMPTTTYMQVDDRRDHSFRVPRPDLTLKTNVPNACNSCHTNKTANWAVDAITSWHPTPKHIGKNHFAISFFTADNGMPNAADMLTKIAQDKKFPDIVRASALTRMTNTPGNNAIVAIARAVKQTDPMQRLAAVSAAKPYNLADRWRLLSTLLSDPYKSVRVEAANSLAAVLVQPLPTPLLAKDKIRLENALTEYQEVQAYQSERGFSHANLGNLALKLNKATEAVTHYETAIRIEPIFMPAYLSLADLYRQWGNEEQALNILNNALAIKADAADVHYNIAMSLIRSQQKVKAINSLKKATHHAPNNANYFYTLGLLLQDQNNKIAAIKAFNRAFTLTPNNPDSSFSLAQAYAADKQYAKALYYAENLQKLVPNNQQINNMVRQFSMMQKNN
jgi:tetratricopeptide (TPR) repeat protein/formate-dependent nitrite reductase cytochrome c552 subunit